MSSSNKTLKAVYDRSCHRPIPPPSKSGPTIKPSMLGSPCVRKVYYSYNKAPEEIPFPLAGARITNLGTAIGKMLFEAYDREGIAIKFRKPDGTYHKDHKTGEDDFEFRLTSPELGIKMGKIDLVCRLDDGLWLAEIKSIKWEQYQELKAPKPDHLIQGVLYLYLFNLALKSGEFAHIAELNGVEKANGIRFLYYGKDKSELKEFVVTTADDVFRNIVLKIQTVKDHSENNTLPPKTFDYCKSCAYQTRCAQNKKAHE